MALYALLAYATAVARSIELSVAMWSMGHSRLAVIVSYQTL